MPVESSREPPSVDYYFLKGGHKERDDFVIVAFSLPPSPCFPSTRAPPAHYPHCSMFPPLPPKPSETRTTPPHRWSLGTQAPPLSSFIWGREHPSSCQLERLCAHAPGVHATFRWSFRVWARWGRGWDEQGGRAKGADLSSQLMQYFIFQCLQKWGCSVTTQAPRVSSEGCWGKGHEVREVVCGIVWFGGRGLGRRWARRKCFFIDVLCMRIRA